MATTQSIPLLSPAGDQHGFSVEIADDPGEWEQGLMRRTRLNDNTGMLFMFKEAQPLSFWMKNTLIPLDIVFFDTDNRFLSAKTMEPCASDPCAIYPSDGSALTAFEVSAGTVKRLGIGPEGMLDLGDVDSPPRRRG